MRHSEFWGLVAEVFADRGSYITQDFVLSQFGNRTAQEALQVGYDPKEVWFALCEAADVPQELHWGKPVPKKRDS